MAAEETPQIKMVLPCKCPHCGEDIVINMDIIPPEVTSVAKPEDVGEDIKKLITKEDDITPESNA